MTATVQPEKILRDLRELWHQLGVQQETTGGVLRACAMTLLVVAEDEADAERVRQTVGVVMHVHPSRAIVLRTSAGTTEVAARVFAECWMPFGSHQQICAEGIEITAGREELHDVARTLLLPLIVPDLPVVLWCRGSRAFSPSAFDPLLPLSEKIIFDSTTAPDPKAAIAVLKDLHGRGRRVADLAWTRLTGWREALSHLFDDGTLKPADVTTARVTYGVESTSVLYFAAWIERAIPGVRLTLETVAGEPGLQSVTLTGSGAELRISLADAGSIEVSVGGRTSRSLLPPATDDALMREELSILGPDATFDAILA